MASDDLVLIPEDEYYRSLARSRVAGGMLFTDTAGRVLVLETTYKPEFEIPGGSCEANESPRATAEREVREELGLEIMAGSLLVIAHHHAPAPKGDILLFIFDGGVIEDTALLQPDAKEIRAMHFVAPDDLPNVCTARMTKRLHTALKARREGITFDYEEEADSD